MVVLFFAGEDSVVTEGFGEDVDGAGLAEGFEDGEFMLARAAEAAVGKDGGGVAG